MALAWVCAALLCGVGLKDLTARLLRVPRLIDRADAQQIWGTAEADVIREGMTPQAAAEKALKRIGEILAKYPIAEG